MSKLAWPFKYTQYKISDLEPILVHFTKQYTLKSHPNHDHHRSSSHAAADVAAVCG